MSDYLTQAELAKFGPRNKAMREASGLSINQVSKLTNFSVYSLHCVESKPDHFEDDTVAWSDVHILLALYHCTLDMLTAEPLKFATDKEALDAFERKEITGEQYIRWIIVDRRTIIADPDQVLDSE